jgi:CheY-like chemotaxis protein
VPRILVADDNSNIQKMVTLALEERGIDVVAVGNGEAAVRRLPDVNPDLVLADVFMPVRNGYEVCEYVKKDTRFAHIPVILLVGAFDPLDEKEARRVGADGVLKKPFVPPDPLIAMVMQVLEKNPRVAAEMAKQKEVIAEPPPPPEMLEAPLRVEPKPLPEFPEPTPEEAAQIYGFGKGVRALAGDDDEEEEEEKHSKKSKGFKSSKTAKAPVAAEAETDDFDNAATASDWRRNAADFEVPENVAQDSVEPVASDYNPSSFPSEKDVPPKHIHNEKFSDREEAPEHRDEPASLPSSHSLEMPLLAEDQASSAFGKVSPVEDAPAISHAKWLREPEPEHDRQLEPSAAASSFEAQEPVREEVRQESQHQESKSNVEPGPSPVPASRATEWMDMMAPPPSEYPDGGWMSNLSAPSTHATSTTQAEPEAKSTTEHAEFSSENHGNGNEAAVRAEEPLHQSSEQEDDFEFSKQPELEDRFFVASPETPKSSYHFASEESRETAAKVQEPQAASEPSNTPDQAQDLLPAPADADSQDDDAASHPSPEPLLVDEEHSDPSLYLPALEPAQHILPASVEQRDRQPDALLEHLEPSVFEPASQSAGVEEFSERIPTLPPPNREALAGIPFLMPPPATPSHEPVETHAQANDAQAVDEVVRKVLEKLQPHLQELFSQGMKPLVENLVHSELSKKDR